MMNESAELLEGLIREISAKAGGVLEHTIKESFLFDSTRSAIAEELREMEEKIGSPEVAPYAQTILYAFDALADRQKRVIRDNLGLLKEGLDTSIDIVRQLAKTAADKSVLEFEIKLLERFIITSEVVRDWKDHVKNILIETSRVLDIYLLFSLFVTDNEQYEMEVFWLDSPSEHTKSTFEQVILNKIAENSAFESVNDIHISHNVARSEQQLPISQESVTLSTKSVFLEAPRIGGIVGLGVNFQSSVDPIKALVIESILTTLLNVVGSIKAIYKYTKDLEYYATRDPLTNQLNQRMFWEFLVYEVGRAKRHGYSMAVLMADVDDFKRLNDTYGHAFGDRFLSELAIVMKEAIRKEDMLARYGGDEFAIILPEVDMEQACLIAERLLEAVRRFSILVEEDNVRVRETVSVGIAIFPHHAAEARDLFLVADNMLYKAKEMGKNRVVFPSQQDVAGVFRNIGEKTFQIMRAIDERRITPYFQPIVQSNSGEIEAYEVLMRIDLPNRIMEAGEFIELAESSGLISQMDYIVTLQKAKERGFKGYLFLNMSPKALIIKEFIPTVRKIVRGSGIDPSQLVLEITERDTVRNVTLLQKFVLDLKYEGFNFAIDDFGSGFASFSYLKRFPIDFVKVDGEFIRGMQQPGSMDRAIVTSIETLAKGAGIRTVAESVEQEEIWADVRNVGIDYVQGYYVGRPAPDFVPPRGSLAGG